MFSITGVKCATGTYTFGHEIGHNLVSACWGLSFGARLGSLTACFFEIERRGAFITAQTMVRVRGLVTLLGGHTLQIGTFDQSWHTAVYVDCAIFTLVEAGAPEFQFSPTTMDSNTMAKTWEMR